MKHRPRISIQRAIRPENRALCLCAESWEQCVCEIEGYELTVGIEFLLLSVPADSHSDEVNL